MSSRIIFMGTPEFAVPTLIELIAHDYEIVAVYTREARPAGRGLQLQRSPVNREADLFEIPVYTPRSLKSEAAVAQFRMHDADLAVVVAYGLILPPGILSGTRYGCLNLHASLLPCWRGAAPLQRSLMAGDTETGVSLMLMDEGLDTGPVAMTERLTIPDEMTYKELHDHLMRIGADLMVRGVAGLARGSLKFRPQSQDNVSYAAKIGKDEAQIDWQRPARQLNNLIRGLSPFPGAFFESDWGEGRIRVKALRSRVVAGQGEPGSLVSDQGMVVACGEGAIELIEVQRAGRSAMSAAEFRRGNKLPRGMMLPSDAG